MLRYDADNVVAVRASTGETGSSRWYTGGGLFRDVHLVVKDTLHNGFAMAILRAGQKAGTVKLKVSAAGLKGVDKTLRVGSGR